MTVKNWPLALNQPGYDYPAELFRAQYFGASAGGTGVADPGALKVVAQPAPDGTVGILPGGAYVRSTYAGVNGQSYYAHNFQPFTLTVPPTGSSPNGRHDLVVLRVCDPQYDKHPDHPGGKITAEEAAEYDFWWFELFQNRSATTSFDFPFVPVAHIRRGPNQTIVRPEDIRDLRELANPQIKPHVRANNMNRGDSQSLHTGSRIWPENATHTVAVPEHATHVQAIANWSNVRMDVVDEEAYALVRTFLVHPDGTEWSTQESRWYRTVGFSGERFNITLGDNRPLPAKFQGQDCRLELRATKMRGPNVYMDGNSSWSVQLFFEQGIS